MARTNGYFEPPSPNRPRRRELARGLALGKVYVPGGAFSVEFEIDTACPWILLVDDDFLRALACLGYRRPQDGPVLQWMHTRIDCLRRVPSPWTPGGRMGPVFRLVCSAIRMSRSDGGEPTNADFWFPLYGAFTRAYYDTGFTIAGKSLLGRELLNRIKRLCWKGPNSVIELSGV
jgi:hypothetical protein